MRRLGEVRSELQKGERRKRTILTDARTFFPVRPLAFASIACYRDSSAGRFKRSGYGSPILFMRRLTAISSVVRLVKIRQIPVVGQFESTGVPQKPLNEYLGIGPRQRLGFRCKLTILIGRRI